MYGKILLPVDNSEESYLSAKVAFTLAKKFNSDVYGLHVYAAKLHDFRFRQMERGLPEHYQREEELKRQRKIHDSLITRGLELISESYLDALESLAQEYNLEFRRVLREGKNYEEIIKEARDYDLVVLSYSGLGKVNGQRIGSVASRVTTKIRADVLILKSEIGDKIAVGIDGSAYSYRAAEIGAELAKAFDSELHLISVYDPFFHTVAFKSIAKVLSEEAGKIFKFKEQEKLHDQIINDGLAKLYREYLESAGEIVKAKGVEPKLNLLAGKPRAKIVEFVRERGISLLILGRWGFHGSSDVLDMGSMPEELLYRAEVNLLITSQEAQAKRKSAQAQSTIKWSPEAEESLTKIPEFARGMAKAMIEAKAREEGLSVITPEFMRKVRSHAGG